MSDYSYLLQSNMINTAEEQVIVNDYTLLYFLNI